MEPLLLCVPCGLSSPAEKVANKWRDNVDIHRPAANLGSSALHANYTPNLLRNPNWCTHTARQHAKTPSCGSPRTPATEMDNAA
jgi:hypothetical protein